MGVGDRGGAVVGAGERGGGGGSWELVSKRGGRGRARSLNIFGGGAL